MRIKCNTFAIKNAPNVKSNKLKANDKVNVNHKKIGGVKDYRKYANDKTLSEAEKIARRMDMENMRSRVNKFSVAQSDKSLFNTQIDKDWESDPMMLKVQQLGKLDEGLDESSDEEADSDNGGREDSSKYFADGKTLKNKKKTLEETIRESKIKKLEKHDANEEKKKIEKNVNEVFSKDVRFLLDKVGPSVKSNNGSKEALKTDPIIADFKADFESMSFAELPKTKVANEIAAIHGSQKNNDRLVNNKIERILKKAGIKDEVTVMNDSDLESGNEEIEDLDSDEDSDNDEEDQSEDDDQSDDEKEDNDESDDEEKDYQSEDNEDENENNEDETDDSEDIEESNVSTLAQLKSIIKASKRKADDSEENEGAKKIKIQSDKNEIDCLRMLVQTNLKQDVLLALSAEIESAEMSRSSVIRKMILAYVFQEALRSNSPHCFSPELIRLIRSILKLSARDSDHWLSINEDCSQIKIDQTLNVCTSDIDSPFLPISTIYHTINLLLSVIDCNRHVASRKSIFVQFIDIINRLPIGLFPDFVTSEIDKLMRKLDTLAVEAMPIMRVKKPYSILTLLEADVEDKFDPKKNLARNDLLNYRKEKKSIKKDIKKGTKAIIVREIAEGRKESEMRKKKTLAVLNNIHQM